MIRYFLAKGDRAGDAVIVEGLRDCTCENPPPRVEIATLDMKTYCTACKREGFIAPTGPRWPGTASNGKQWALSGDINVCGCHPPPVFHAQRGMSMTFTAEEVAALVGSNSPSSAFDDVGGNYASIASTTAPSHTGNVSTYNRRFQIQDQETGAPLANRPYRLSYSGGVMEGYTDSYGYTERIGSERPEIIQIEVF